MSIFRTKEADGTVNALVFGKVTRDPTLNPKGDRIRFGVAYGKGKFMDIQAFADSPAGQLAGYLEKGDHVCVAGLWESWQREDKTYSAVRADWLSVQQTAAGGGPADSAPGGDAEFVEEDVDDDDLPF